MACPRCGSDDPTVCRWVWLDLTPPHTHGSYTSCCPDPFHHSPPAGSGPTMRRIRAAALVVLVLVAVGCKTKGQVLREHGDRIEQLERRVERLERTR